MRKLSFALLLPLVFAACAFNDDGSDPTRRAQIEDRQKIIGSYRAIQGVYEGNFTKPDGVEKVKFVVAYREKQSGTDNEGVPIYQPILTAKFDRFDSTYNDVNMEGSYLPEIAEITLITRLFAGPGGQQIYDGTYFYIRGNITGGRFTAEVRTDKGARAGEINLTKTSEIVDVPKDGELLDKYEEYRERLLRFVGKYVGVAKATSKNEKDMQIEMILDIEDGPKDTLPKLVSTSYRTDGFSRAARHVINYDYLRNIHELTFLPSEGASGFDAFTMTSTWDNGVISGNIRLPKNPTREFKAERVNK